MNKINMFYDINFYLFIFINSINEYIYLIIY